MDVHQPCTVRTRRVPSSSENASSSWTSAPGAISPQCSLWSDASLRIIRGFFVATTPHSGTPRASLGLPLLSRSLTAPG
eukprot:5367504-Prymnesium_polylepis.1